jgi:hypothetical protein
MQKHASTDHNTTTETTTATRPVTSVFRVVRLARMPTNNAGLA